MRAEAIKLYRKYQKNRQKYDKYKHDLHYASQYKLMGYKFRKHRVAVISLWLLGLMYFIAIFSDFIAPYPKSGRIKDQQYRPPTAIRFVDGDGLSLPYVYDLKKELNEENFKYEYMPDPERKLPLRLLIKSEPYRLFGLIPMNRRLFGVEEGYINLFGTNKLGLDIFSQTLYASRISLFIGLIGVFISFILGVILGGLSGYFGGRIDDLIQRSIDLLMSIPKLPLWIAMSAAIPKHWSGAQTFFAITIILSLVGWTGLARVVRGRLISMREEDYVMAAKVAGASDYAIIGRHLIPGIISYLVVNITLAIPGMILGETTLSFLGLGILPPEVSWGALLQDAQQITVIANYPWYLIPGLFLVVTVLLFNFIGDGLRDAADPYS